MVSVVAVIITVLGAAIGITGGLVGFLLFPKLVEDRIEESVRLVEGSEAWERWENLPIPVAYKVYFFNVSNPEEVQNGSQPIVQEIGPYIYNQYRAKINITAEDDILSYYQHQLFEFDEEASAPLTDSDELTIVNLPLMATVTIGEYNAGTTSLYQLTALNTAIPNIFSSPSSVFITTTPRDFLFDGIYVLCNSTGIIDIIVCNRIANNAPITMPRLDDGRFKFSLFSHKNDTHDGYYSINSGTSDINQLGEIVSWENSSTLEIWGENGTCNDIVGSDSTIFPPFVTEDSVLNVFSTDICRSMSVQFSEASEYAGIDSYKYVVGEWALDSPSNYSENECFCLNKTEGITGDDGCLLDGVMELWDCQGAPVVLSFPHFYLANEAYQTGVSGLSPNESLHRTFLELEPMTGTPLRGSKKVQFNIFIRQVERIGITANLPTVLMPIVWIDEGVELNDEMIGLLNAQLFDILRILEIVKWSTIGGGAVLFIAGFTWAIMSVKKSKKVY